MTCAIAIMWDAHFNTKGSAVKGFINAFWIIYAGKPTKILTIHEGKIFFQHPKHTNVGTPENDPKWHRSAFEPTMPFFNKYL